MTNEAPAGEKALPKGWRLWARGGSRLGLVVVVTGGALFAAAGRLDWLAAWLLTGGYTLYLAVVMIWAVRNAPELAAERGRVAANVKTWDKLINAGYALLLVALLVVAGLDAGRYAWSVFPPALQLIGGAGAALSGWAIWRVMAENTFASRYARIQDDRGQRVVSSGPYRLVRHPMYAVIIVLMVCLALALGSWWAVIPAGLIGVLFVLRTALEDRMLHKELAGYREYAARVRYRLAPGLW